MKKLIFVPILFFSICYAESLFSPLPQDISYDKQKVQLGKKLFFDPILSKNNDIACISCHHSYGTDNLPVSIGTDGKKGVMNSPSIYNLPYKIAYFWNGRSLSLQDQITDGPLFNTHEMANDKTTIEKRLLNSSQYTTLFQQTYKKPPSFDLMIDALVEFQKTLISSESKFDKFLRKEIPLTQDEEKGLELFINYGCASCHNGINIGGNSYQKLGTVVTFDATALNTDDRAKVTHNAQDTLTFIVPSLRNVAKTYPYFHDGSISTLKEAIQKMAYHNIGTILSKKEVNYIESFLKTLTGKIPETIKEK